MSSDRKSELSEFINENLLFGLEQPEQLTASIILIIYNYQPDESQKKVSFAFNLTDFIYNNQNKFSGRQCWATESNIEGLNPHADYIEFNHEGYLFHPFSADLEEFSVTAKENLFDLLARLYQSINFSNDDV